jgi:phosphoglucomutase
MSSIQFASFQDQKPGTSGLRKKVVVFQTKHYTESFVQSIITAIEPNPVLVIGGDGRFFNKQAITIIAQIARGNQVKKLIIAKSGILSTPAASNLIRIRKATGGILLTASHNPGGVDNDFGIKYNISNGGPAPESVTEKIFEISKSLTAYKVAEIDGLDLELVGCRQFGEMEVEVVDGITDYVVMVKEIFDFTAIKVFLDANPKFTFLFDAMNAGTNNLDC